MDDTAAAGGDSEAQAILSEVEAEFGPSGGGTSEEAQTPAQGAQAEPAHSDPGQTPKFIEIAGQKFTDQQAVNRWAERLFKSNASLGRDFSEHKKRYERAIKFQERLEKEPEYLQALTKAETEFDRAKSQGATNQQAQKAALDAMPPEFKATIDKVNRFEQREQEREAKAEAKADAERTVKERADFEKAHPDLKPDKYEKVVELMLHHAKDGKGFEVSYEDALMEIEIDEARAKNKSQADTIRKVKADSDIGPGQGSPHTPKKRDFSKEGTDDEFARNLVSELQAGGHIPPD